MIEATPRFTQQTTNGPNTTVEFKQTMRWDVEKGMVSDDILRACVKTVCAFLNGAGGTLLIGVADSRQPIGLQNDLKDPKCDSIESKSVDWFELTFRQSLANGLKPEMNNLVTVSFPRVGGVQICRVDVKPAPEPIFLVVKNVPEFYVLQGNLSRPLDIKSAVDYVRQRWEHSTGSVK
jgi:predicted HTH transcriptional regulator